MVDVEAGVIRGFLAIELPSDVRVRLASIQQDLKRCIEQTADQVRISWVRPASMHLTVRFLGDMREEVIEPLRACIEEAVSTHQPLSLPLETIGTFPNRTQPRVVWAGPSERWREELESKRLTALHRAIEDACQTEGFASEERPFSPHLTLARIKEAERTVGQALVSTDIMNKPALVEPLPIEAIALMRSGLHRSGSIYTKLWEVRIGKT